MTREEAIELLDASSSHDRLRGARQLVTLAEPNDVATLWKARRTERVVLVQRTLDRAINRLADETPPAVEQNDEVSDVPEELRSYYRTQAIEWISGLLLHELSSPLGLIEWSASREIDDYAASETKQHLDRFKRLFEAIEQLKGATAVPRHQEFELSGLIDEIIIGETHSSSIEISIQGQRPFLVTSDTAILRLAIANGIRNAMDSVTELGDQGPHSIVVSWGSTNLDHFVSVIDSGKGLQGPPEHAFAIGKTTKPRHAGFGLAIARQAMSSLEGKVTLQPAATRGACYEIRWKK